MLLYSLILQRAENNFPKELSNLCRSVEHALVNRSAKDFQSNGCEGRTFDYNMVLSLFVLTTTSAQGVNIFLDDYLVSLYEVVASN